MIAKAFREREIKRLYGIVEMNEVYVKAGLKERNNRRKNKGFEEKKQGKGIEKGNI
ncbi:MAG: hypothetical protein RMK94_16395 [Armatimonadota bacterium]|nr:hypothetical protein [Armatimonadota bacterium]